MATTAKANQLPAQILPKGECGLFVWTASSDRRFILFAQSQRFTATFQDATEQTPLSITAQNGVPTQNQFPMQTYNRGQVLHLRQAQTITGGTRYQAGTLSFKNADGWDNVIPVVGLSACR